MKKIFYALWGICLIAFLSGCADIFGLGGTPDLKADRVWTYPEKVVAGTGAFIKHSVFNAGTGNARAESYVVELTINGEMFSRDNATPEIFPQRYTTYTSMGQNWFPKMAGEYKYCLKVIPNDGVDDLSATNNILEGIITVE